MIFTKQHRTDLFEVTITFRRVGAFPAATIDLRALQSSGDQFPLDPYASVSCNYLPSDGDNRAFAKQLVVRRQELGTEEHQELYALALPVLMSEARSLEHRMNHLANPANYLDALLDAFVSRADKLEEVLFLFPDTGNKDLLGKALTMVFGDMLKNDGSQETQLPNGAINILNMLVYENMRFAEATGIKIPSAYEAYQALTKTEAAQ